MRRCSRGCFPGFDTVVNFAAETHVDRSIMGGVHRDFLHTNVVGAQTLFEACLQAGVGRVLHVSTDEVYGSIEAPGFRGRGLAAPARTSPYSAAKAGGDLLARAYARHHGLNITVTRCTNNYGPYQFPEKVIPLFVTNLLDGKQVPLYGDGLNVRDWLHVDDHCRGIQLALEHGEAGETTTSAAGRSCTNADLTEMLLAATGRGWPRVIEPVADRKGHDRRYSVDGSKLAALGYAPQIPFADGLAATVAWYRDNESWWRPLKARAALV